jgi:hypothetical protein
MRKARKKSAMKSPSRKGFSVLRNRYTSILLRCLFASVFLAIVGMSIRTMDMYDVHSVEATVVDIRINESGGGRSGRSPYEIRYRAGDRSFFLPVLYEKYALARPGQETSLQVTDYQMGAVSTMERILHFVSWTSLFGSGYLLFLMIAVPGVLFWKRRKCQ